MSVNKSSIYGLLGPSGGGKTTILNCIVGKLKLDAGAISVLGAKPGSRKSGVPGKRVGYMPQELSLYDEFTIYETLRYFGWIFGMSSKDIKERVAFLLQFLDLNNRNKLVKKLSGGQKRRVSLSAALIHSPELLILDEPTVGVDPLLRMSIWEHLLTIVSEGNTTIIITTHYIEEARQANTIGLLRGGKLLAESSPTELLKQYKSSTLEEVFVILSQQQDLDEEQGMVTESRPEKEVSECPHGYTNTGVISYKYKNPIWGKSKALVIKNFIRLWRNPGFMLFVFLLPIVQVTLFSFTIGREPKELHLAIVNEEWTNGSLSECPFENALIIGKVCILKYLSCRYLNALPRDTYIMDEFDNVQDAIDRVKDRKAWAALHFRSDFTKRIYQRIIAGEKVDDETLESGEVKIYTDSSDRQIAFVVNRDLFFAFRDFVSGALTECHLNPKLGEFPAYFEKIHGTNDPTYTDFVAPGITLTIVHFLAVALTTTTIIIERTEGLLDRSWIAGVRPIELLMSHIATQFVVVCMQITLVLVFMFLVFEIQNLGSMYLIISLTLLQGLCGMCFGFVISVVCNTERGAVLLSLGNFFPILLLSGVIWPIEGMPVVLRFLTKFLPLTLAVISLRDIQLVGWGFEKVYMGYVASVIWIFIYLVFTVGVLSYKKRKGF